MSIWGFNMPSKKVIVVCSMCNKEFYRNPSDIKNVLKSKGHYLCKKCSYTRTKMIRTDIDESELCKQYLRGLSMLDLAKEYHCSLGTISRRLGCNDVIKRTGSERIRNAIHQGKTVGSMVGSGVGFTVDGKGYYRFTSGVLNGKFIHRIKMEKHIGRKILKSEVVHHVDENRTNNDIENLQLMTRGEHTTLHNILRTGGSNGK